MAVGARKPGQFCWINILSPEPAKACEFFTKVLGWSYFDMGGMGYGIRVGGKDMGGLFDLNGPNTPPGTPPVIGVMVRVDSADQTAERVKALGGTALPPMDIFDSGRMVVCHDPNGANFDVWQARKSPGTEVDDTQHGAFSWSELIATDVGKAEGFYSKLFGWTTEAMPMPDFTYTVFRLGEERVAGMMPLLPDMGEMPSHWGTYFTVTNVDETVKVAAAAGGTICMEPMDIPGVGRFAMIASPQGVRFYVITYLPM